MIAGPTPIWATACIWALIACCAWTTWRLARLARQHDEARTALLLAQDKARLAQCAVDACVGSLNEQTHTIAALRTELDAQVWLTGEARQDAQCWREVARGKAMAGRRVDS